MYDLNDLEQKWISYKRQKYKKFASLGAAFFGVAVASFVTSYLIFSHKHESEVVKKERNETNTTIQAQKSNDVVELTLAGEQPMQREIVIVSPTENTQEFKSLAPTNEQQLTPPAAEQQIPAAPPKPKAPPKIQIETKSANRTALLEDRFKRNGDIETALLLSEEYYKMGDYQNALKWAISANSLDAKNEKSWALFAKSSYKLGRKQDAINALENFTKMGGSDQIKTLLRQIRAGEL